MRHPRRRAAPGSDEYQARSTSTGTAGVAVPALAGVTRGAGSARSSERMPDEAVTVTVRRTPARSGARNEH